MTFKNIDGVFAYLTLIGWVLIKCMTTGYFIFHATYSLREKSKVRARARNSLLRLTTKPPALSSLRSITKLHENPGSEINDDDNYCSVQMTGVTGR